MRQRIYRGTAILLLAALVLSLGACSMESGQINGVMNDFEKACRNLDINGIVDCLDPSVAGGVKLLTGIAGMIADKDTDEILSGLAAALVGEMPENARDFFSSIRFQTENVRVHGDNASANVTISYTMSGEDFEHATEFSYIKSGDKWYIANLTLE